MIYRCYTDGEKYQEYQAGYHKGYEHGIMDASKLTWEDARLLSDIEYNELNEKNNYGVPLEDVYKIIAERFNKERSERLKKKANASK